MLWIKICLLPLLPSAYASTVSVVADNTCPVRKCLPKDTSGGAVIEGLQSKLCYTFTGTHEDFATCDEGTSCAICTSEPPCESWCQPETYTPKNLGEACHFDHECNSEQFGACHLGLCRKVLWAGQSCDENDADSVCLFGRQQCINGRCYGLGTNQPCWDGYPQGRDVDCQMGWYCLRGICVPQLPNGHTCYGEHEYECIRGHRCNFHNTRPQCTPEYSLLVGMRASSAILCRTSHIDPHSGECASVPPEQDFGKDCHSSADCIRSDGSKGDCRCKQWWNGDGVERFCERIIADRDRPFFMEFWGLRKVRCQHEWPDDRCAQELKEYPLLIKVREEAQASADPTEIEACGYQLLGVISSRVSYQHQQWFVLPIALWISGI